MFIPTRMTIRCIRKQARSDSAPAVLGSDDAIVSTVSLVIESTATESATDSYTTRANHSEYGYTRICIALRN
jgi:hypothetical protein